MKQVIKILDEFEIDEVSAVDMPAQEGALIVLAKNASGAANTQSTTQVKDSMEPDKNPAPDQGLQKQLAAAEAQLAVAKAYGTLSDEEKRYHAGLSADAQEAFLKQDVGARRRAVEAAREADAVVYTSDTGEAFRKSDDPRLVRLAKQADESARLAKAEREAREGDQLAKQAGDKLSHLPGTVPHKVALLKAIAAVSDSAARTGIEQLLAAADTAMAKGFEKRGVSGENNSDAQTKLDALVKARAQADNVSKFEALDRVLMTDEGQDLAVEIRVGGN